jgi:hypothetical protein
MLAMSLGVSVGATQDRSQQTPEQLRRQQAQRESDRRNSDDELELRRTVDAPPPASDDSVWVESWGRPVRPSDLLGEWINSWYDAGTFVHESFTLNSDGSFTGWVKMRGAQKYDETTDGTYALSPKPVLRYTNPSKRPLNMLDFTQLPDGSAEMHVLDSQYPINHSNRLYQEKLVRAAPRERVN